MTRFAQILANLALFSVNLFAESSTNALYESQDLGILPPPPSHLQVPIEVCESANISQDSRENPAPQDTLSRFFALNPAFGDKQNAIRFEFGASVRSSGFENLYNAQILYSQPNRFFRIHGRLNVEIGGFFGFHDKNAKMDLSALNLAFVGVSEDILLPLFISETHGNFYAGLGIGAYIKSKGEARVGSNFTFGERVFVGYLWQNFSVEIFVKHFSNGTLAVPNNGHNFFGITSGYVF